jgi:hypothetical protein
MEVADIDGTLTGVSVGLEHCTFKNFGFGLRYNWSLWDIESTDRSLFGNMRLEIQGANLYVRLYF